ncbi:MAG: EAL domain-containing protein [Ectothiorhodospiraceae bacterium]|nr:EAL domain-containing protein [Ectothiorhodospiraceae bacterium]
MSGGLTHIHADPSCDARARGRRSALDRALTQLHGAPGRTVAAFGDFTLTSAFQPIVGLAHRRTVGFEALVRADDAAGAAVPPPVLFGSVHKEAEIVALDRLCRALHVANFAGHRDPATWLFLNVDPTVATRGAKHGSFFAELLAHHAFAPQRVVIEVLESAIADETHLADTLGYYRSLGCLVALDDFGSGNSNIERIWRIAPDIVKLDRSLIVEAAQGPRHRRILRNLVALMHEAGCLALMEGIETETEALTALDCDMDLAQGWFFARPAAIERFQHDQPAAPLVLYDRFRDRVRRDAERERQFLAPYEIAFRHAALGIEAQQTVEIACYRLLAQAGVERCYLLDEQGTQIGPNLIGRKAVSAARQNAAPLADATGASWSHRQYFRNANAAPGKVCITQPYLSVTGCHMCVTLSIALDTADGRRVLCCDLVWEGG